MFAKIKQVGIILWTVIASAAAVVKKMSEQ